jgi:hypothetical protein
MKMKSTLLFAGMALLVAGGRARAQDRTGPPQAQAQQGASDWRVRMQQNHNAEQSIGQEVGRLTKVLELTPDQQTKVRQLAWVHHDRIQKILDSAPPTLTRADFNTQVHAISAQFHDSVNAMLSPHQLELMKSMLGHGSGGLGSRRAP